MLDMISVPARPRAWFPLNPMPLITCECESEHCS